MEVIMRSISRVLAPLSLLSTMLLTAGTANAAPTLRDKFDTFTFNVSTCNQEVITGSGTEFTSFRQLKDGSNISKFDIHAKGVGTQGNVYVLDVSSTVLTDPTTGAFSSDQVQRLVSLGSAPNEQINFHFDTVNGVSFSIICKG
jgi:hypothetical protein